MNPTLIFTLVYFLTGIILAFIWWNDEYEGEMENDEEEHSMVCILLLGLMFFWPIKLIKDWFEGLWQE